MALMIRTGQGFRAETLCIGVDLFGRRKRAVEKDCHRERKLGPVRVDFRGSTISVAARQA